MGLLGELVLLPLAPVRTVLWVAEYIQAEAAAQQDPIAEIRRQLSQTELDLAAGTLDDARCAAIQDELLTRLFELSEQGAGP